MLELTCWCWALPLSPSSPVTHIHTRTLHTHTTHTHTTHTHTHTHTLHTHIPAEGLLRVFYNSDFAFSHRLYGSLDVDLPRVLLYQPLSELLQQSVLYVRGSIPRRCFCALVRLSQLALVSEMSDLTRNELFPTVEEVVALGLQFAVPLTFEMEDGMCRIQS